MQLGVSGEIGSGQGILEIADWEKEAGFGSGEGRCGRYEWYGAYETPPHYIQVRYEIPPGVDPVPG